MAPPLTEVESICWSLLLIYRARRDERLSWPGWFTYSGWFIHISGHLLATGRAQDKGVRRRKDRRSIPLYYATNQLKGGGTLQEEGYRHICYRCKSGVLLRATIGLRL